MASIINASTSSGIVQTADTSGVLKLQTASTDALQVNSNQTVQVVSAIGVGGATPTSSGAGITFPATQSASTDANTLDDYEEGTFTPIVIDNSNNQPSSYSSQFGNYVKIGNQVIVSVYIALGTKGATISGTVGIGNLPFTSKSGNYWSGSCGYWGGMASSLIWLSGFVNPSASKMIMYKIGRAHV